MGPEPPFPVSQYVLPPPPGATAASSPLLAPPPPPPRVINITVYRDVSMIRETEMRKNPYYYRYYYVYLNMLFSTVIPLATLSYLNIFTFKALR